MNFSLPDWLPAESCQSLFLELVSEDSLEVCHGPDIDPARLSVGEVEARIVLNDVKDLFFGLTESGGKEWEARAQPDWSRDISHWATSDELDLACASFERLGAHLGWLRVSERVDITWETVQSEVRATHEMTYWKTLENVHCLHCKVTSCGGGIGWPDWYRRWRDVFYRWYQPLRPPESP